MISLPINNLMTKSPCFIFDIDGTLADMDHRVHHVESYPKNWDAFNREMVNDSVYESVRAIFHSLNETYTTILLTGRGEEYREETETWLEENNIKPDALLMRQAEDFRPDYEIKSEIADVISQDFDILGVFEDRPSVVKMWIERGIFVFNCSQGRVEF